MNLVLWYKGSSAAIPFFTLVALLALWFGVSVPLTFVGAFFGFRKRAMEHPVRTNQIPRQIPEQSIYTQPIPGIIMGGVLPFGCIFIQLFFVLNSIWSSQIYYMYGFLFLVFIILIITCSETTILLCYFHLCAEVRLQTEERSSQTLVHPICNTATTFIRTTIGGGGASLPVASQHSTCLCTASITSSRSWRSVALHRHSCILGTPPSWCSCFSCLQVRKEQPYLMLLEKS